MVTKDTAYKKTAELVDRFGEQYDSYKRADYNETLTRRDFIDPFFKSLGWDIDNENGYAESYREVIHEDKVKVGKATKAPDYSFRLVGGKRLFFVEAKKPSVKVKEEIQPAYQVRRYGWSAKLPISIITDFEEFAVYDCTKRPSPTDKASTARINYFTYQDYLKEFDFFWDTFSKERVLKGSFDKFVQGSANKKGTATVDKEFLQSLDSWRTYLATSISWNNKHLDEDEINFAVQQTIDRLIFLRIAEDRGVEHYGMLKNVIASEAKQSHNNGYYHNLFHLFQQADDKYNSGLFDFKKDKISADLTIDNKVLKTIISELYYPVSPYEFSVLSVEILGSAYEQFLGKQIKVDKAHRAHIEEKPEVRKAGGVYYTPEYVVEYIVRNTVGKLIEGKKPKDIEKIKIVDPACGSGSFLIGAYQYLLDWHKAFYLPDFKRLTELSTSQKYTVAERNKSIRERNKLPLTPNGELTTRLKKEILLNNIFGADLDVNAVEVTKLSLLLKCMEGETQSSMTQEMSYGERVLPTLDNNIKSGNSLVDTDFYDSQLEFDSEKKIKPFNWKNGFPEIFKQGGFDAVIGNPPWVDIKGHPSELVRYYFDKFKTTENRINLYSIFVEQGLNILSPKGYFGYIIPNSILYQSSYEKIRQHILKNFSINSIVRLPDNVFQNVKAETIILNISKNQTKTECLLYERTETVSEISSTNCKEKKSLDAKNWIKNEFSVFDIFSNKSEIELLKKIEKEKTELISLCDFTLGLTPYDKYKGHSQKQIKERVFHATYQKDKTFKPLLEGADVKRYSVDWSGKEYISYGSWLGAPREQRFFTSPRILIRQIVSGKPLRIYAGYTEKELYNTQSVFNLISKDEKKLNTKYLLALLNSNLINFYHGHKYLDLSKNLFQKILIQNCKKFPIKTISSKNKDDIQKQTEIVEFVNELLKLNQEKAETKLETKISQLQGKIDYCENKINELVYQLYELTAEEIKIVEGE